MGCAAAVAAAPADPHLGGEREGEEKGSVCHPYPALSPCLCAI